MTKGIIQFSNSGVAVTDPTALDAFSSIARGINVPVTQIAVTRSGATLWLEAHKGEQRIAAIAFVDGQPGSVGSADGYINRMEPVEKAVRGLGQSLLTGKSGKLTGTGFGSA